VTAVVAGFVDILTKVGIGSFAPWQVERPKCSPQDIRAVRIAEGANLWNTSRLLQVTILFLVAPGTSTAEALIPAAPSGQPSNPDETQVLGRF